MSQENEGSTLIFPKATPPLHKSAGLGIRRTGYVALRAPDPAAAAEFAIAHMGFTLAGRDDEGCYYLAAAGPDRYSLVYTLGATALDHVCYLVQDEATLDKAAVRLERAGVPVIRHDASQWNYARSLSFKTPAGHTIRLSPGSTPDIPVGASTQRPAIGGTPITCDHIVVRCDDARSEIAFATETLGLMESSRIEAPDGTPLLTFFRAGKLYHCLAVANSAMNGLHHMQFTLKDGAAIFESWEKMRKEGKVELLWGPVRHGPGHNIAFYFRDQAGHVVEYSAEEELILDDTGYFPMRWSAEDPRSMDEWGTRPPESFL